MTFLNPRKQHGRFQEAAPWERDANVTDVYLADQLYTGFKNSGGTISSWTAAKGSTSPTLIVNVLYSSTFNGKQVGSAQLSVIGSSNVRIDALATAISGTAKPFTLIIAGQMPAAPGSNWYLWAFTKNGNAIPAIAAAGAGGSTSFGISRRNDANVQFNSSAVSPGTSRFVHTSIYTGSTMTTRFNRTLVDNAIAFGGGALTVDHFAIGQAPDLGGGYSNPNIRALVFAPSALPSSSYLPIENYILRRIGL